MKLEKTSAPPPPPVAELAERPPALEFRLRYGVTVRAIWPALTGNRAFLRAWAVRRTRAEPKREA